MAQATCRRVLLLLLRRRGLTDAEGLIPRDDMSAEEQVAERATKQPSLLAQVDERGRVRRVRPSPRPARVGEVRGFSVHAGVFASDDDRVRRARILRYCLRPPFASAQLRETDDGRVAFELRHARWDGATHVVFTEEGVVRRLAALVPPKGRHVVRYFGVLSSASRLRPLVVPVPRVELGVRPALTPTEVPAPALQRRRATWAQLLRRVYGIEGKRCPSCGGDLKSIAAVLEAKAVRAILGHFGLADDPPPPRRRELFPP